MQAEIVFDLETQRLAAEVGGWEHKNRLGLACAVTLNTATMEYQRFLEHEAEALVAALRGASRVIGFNLVSFDYEVLQPYTEVPLATLPTLDLLQQIHATLGFRLSLNALAEATLGVKKSADGVQAVHWYRAGEIQKVLDYCQEDVHLTNQLYLFGKQNRFLHYRDRNLGLRRVAVHW